ncbi:MAG: TonB-dependent receptor [Dysgonamonadaceae bacterium]|jgi:TonB-linked SusC/RagA family outer membrane protein|nr:TonB-dependent receptor [Dysgonamonadaceae bacterium]
MKQLHPNCIVLLLFLLGLSFATKAQTQKITLPQRQMTILSAFEEVEKQTQLTIAYNEAILNVNRKISVNATNKPLSEVMQVILKGTNTTFKIQGKQIIIVTEHFASTPNRYTGTVADPKGEAVTGATIRLKDGSAGAISDINGNFVLDAAVGSMIRISYVGYVTQDVKLGEQQHLKIVLQEDSRLMDEVVVVGYGTQRKVSITGAVAAVSGNEISTTKNENLMNALSGKMAGLRVVQNTAEPGVFTNSFEMRDFGTPLVIIDGVPRDNMARINSEDVESISLLKDAASAAVYGVRAANGVVLITTKQGLNQKLQLKYSGNFAMQMPSGFPKTINAVEYMTLLNEKAMHSVDNPQRIFSDADIEPYRNGSLPSTDWYSELIRDVVPQTQHTISATGGNDKTHYYLSLGYQYQDGFLKSGSINYGRYNVRSNVSSRLTDRIKVGLNMSAIMDERHRPYEGMDQVNKSFWRSNPKDPIFANNRENYYNNGSVDANNPIAMSIADMAGYRNSAKRWLQSTFNIEYKMPFIEGLKAKGLFSYDYNTTINKDYKRTYSIYKYSAKDDSYVETIKQSPATLRRTFSEDDILLYNVSLNYNRLFTEKHDIGALLLFEEQRQKGDNFYAQRDLPLPVDQLFAGSSDNVLGGSDIANVYEHANRAIVGRVTYAFNSKYMAEVSFRYDASSKFARNATWALFPSASLGWRISEEVFWKNSLFAVINNFKLRASYGKVGDDGALDYQWLAGYIYPVAGTPRKKPGGYVIDGKYIAASEIMDVINPNISWNESTTSNIGIDMDGWKGLAGFTFDMFRRNRSGLLATRLAELPGIVGAGLPQENLESDRTEGFELELRHRNHINKVKYSISGVFSFAHTKNIFAVEEKAGNSYENWIRSKSNRYTYATWGWGKDGRYESWDQIVNSPVYTSSGTIIGDYVYQDWNGDGEISDLDRYPFAYGDKPLINYGMTFNIEYKGLDFNMLWQGAAITSVAYVEQLREPMWGSSTGSSLKQFMDRWHPADPTADPYAYGTQWISGHYAFTGTNPDVDSEFNRQNSSYLRLKSIELGYSIPEKINRMFGIQGMRIYANAYNLLTFTKVNAIDPEHPATTNDGYLYPLNKTVTFGLNVNF